MAMGFSMIGGFVLLFFGLSLAPLPIGVPPLPENPALVRAAPADCVFFLQWFGRGEVDAGTRNLSEQLAAEPELRTLADTVRDALRAMIAREYREDGAEAAFDGLEACLERPGCAFVFNMRAGQWGPDASFGAFVDLGPRAAEIEAGMHAMAEMSGLGPDAAPTEIGGTEMYPLSADACWGTASGMLVIASDHEAAGTLLANLRGDGDTRGLVANPRYEQAQRLAEVARPVFRSFVDIATLLENTGVRSEREFPIWNELLGIDAMQAVAAEGGLEGKGFVQRTALATEGLPALLERWDPRELEPSDFELVPADAIVALGARASARDLLEQALEIANGAVPGGAAFVRQSGLAGVSQMLGVDVENDLIAHLADSTLLWSAPSQSGSLLYNGLTIAMPLRDAAAFEASFTRAMQNLKQMFPPRDDSRRRGYCVEQIDGHAHPIWFLDVLGDEMPVAPAWCVTDTHLLLSVFPQNIVDVLETGPQAEPTLARDPEFAAHVASQDGAVLAGLVDTGQLLPLIYPVAQIGAQLAMRELRREGFDIDISALPRLRTFTPYLRREMVRVDVGTRGVLATRTGTIPSADPLVLLTVPLFGMRMSTARMVAAAQAPIAVAVPAQPVPVTEAAPPMPADAELEMKRGKAQAYVQAIAAAARKYRTDHGVIPTLEQLLKPDAAGVRYLSGDAWAADPWGQPFTIGPGENGGILVTSLGPDGEAGTADDITDNR